MQGSRHEAIGELAEKILAVAETTYDNAPKLILDNNQPDPPPLSWHAAYCGAQFAEAMLRLCVLRKAQVDSMALQVRSLPVEYPKGFVEILARCEGEANRMLKAFNIELAQEL